MSVKLSIILPTYNERGNVVQLVKELLKISTKLNKPFEILVIDDNSGDGTADFCRDAFRENKNVKIFLRKEEKGLATAVKFGMERAAGDCVMVMEADFNHDPQIIPLMLGQLKENNRGCQVFS